MNVLISACLLGLNCRYDGSTNKKEFVEKLKEKYHLIPICPEIMGGLQTPREAAEIREDRVMTKSGLDVTSAYEAGALEVEKLAEFYDAKVAVLKEKSPSCGHGEIYDGTFTKRRISGDGKTAALLLKRGCMIIGETKAEEIVKQNSTLESLYASYFKEGSGKPKSPKS